MQELGVVGRSWLQPGRQLGFVDWEALPGLCQRIIIKSRGHGCVYARAQLLQLRIGEVLAQHRAAGVAGTANQPCVAWLGWRHQGEVWWGQQTACSMESGGWSFSGGRGFWMSEQVECRVRRAACTHDGRACMSAGTLTQAVAVHAVSCIIHARCAEQFDCQG